MTIQDNQNKNKEVVTSEKSKFRTWRKRPKQNRLSQRLSDRNTRENLSAGIIIAGVALVGLHYLFSSYAATPYSSSIAANGVITTGANKTVDPTASSDNKVVFGNSTTSTTTPNELLNRQSDVGIYPASAAASNGNYYNAWSPGTSTGTVSYDLSQVPAANRSKVLLAWSSAYDNGYTPDTFMNGECAAGTGTSLPVNYTIDVNSAAGGTSPPTTGWVNEATVTNNIFYARQSLVNMINPTTNTPYNWIRMNVTSSTNTNLDLNFDLANASQGITSDFMFIGDSITTFFAGHDNDGTQGDDIADLVSQAMGGSSHIITQNSGVSCTTSANWDSVYSAFSSSLTINAVLANFPGNYVTLDLGTNDAYSGGGNADAYYSTMQTLANDVIAAGKTPIIPDIPWPNNGDGTAWDNQVKSFNSEISQLIASNPKIIAGPNMYSILQDHTSWFGAPSDGVGDVHPNDDGIIAYRCAWAYAITQNVYHITPAAISECAPYVSP